MKKLLLLLTVAVAMSAPAADFTTEWRPLNIPATVCSNDRLNVDGAKILKNTDQINQRPSFTTVFEERPEGIIKAYNRSGGAFIRHPEGYLQVAPQSGKVYVVYAEDNKVFLQNPVYGLKTGYWVEGALSEDGTQIIVPMGQSLYEDENGITLDLCWASTDYTYYEDSDGAHVRIVFTILEDVKEAVYTIDGNNIYLEGTKGNIDADFPENGVMTGLSAAWHDTGVWASSIDYGTVYTERPYVEPPVIITQQPEGELVDFFRTGESLVPTDYGLLNITQEGKAYVVYCEDGKVYLQDPIYGIVTGAWMEGSINDDGTTITVPMDQCIYWNDDEELGLFLKRVVMDVATDGKISYTIDERTTEMTYTVNGNTITLNDTYGDMNAEWPTQICGYGCFWSDMAFSGLMDLNTAYNRIVPAVPADPSLDEAYTGHVHAWYDCGNESGGSHLLHYIKLEDIDGNLIDRDRVSYSIFTDDDQIYYFSVDDYNQLDEDKTELPYNLHLIYGGISPNITSFYRTNAEGFKPFFSRRIGIQVYYTVDGIRNASNIVYCGIEPSYAKNGIPKNPTADDWYDCSNETGYSKFSYTINKHTTDGLHMDPSRIYYSIFTDDDQLFTFGANDYSYDLDEDMTLIPYNFTGIDIHNNYSYFYRTNAGGYDPFFNHQIGLQVYYLCENGEMTTSDIVYYEVFEHDTNVNEVADCKTIAGVRYYNMAGQEMREANGICIAVITYADGTTSTIKLVK